MLQKIKQLYNSFINRGSTSASNNQLSTADDFGQGVSGETSGSFRLSNGKMFNPLHPNIDAIDETVIARSEALNCRWNGQLKVPEVYSIAQHSWLASYLCDQEDALEGLMHDAAEALGLTDVPRPIKYQPFMQGYRDTEKVCEAAICQKFGLKEIKPPSVARADNLLLCIECAYLVPGEPFDWAVPVLEELNGLVRFNDGRVFDLETIMKIMTPKAAEQAFLTRYYELVNGRKTEEALVRAREQDDSLTTVEDFHSKYTDQIAVQA